MTSRRATQLKVAGLVLLAVVLVIVSVAAMPMVKGWWKPAGGESEVPGRGANAAHLSAWDPDAICLPPDVVKSLGIRAGRALAPATLPGDEAEKWSRTLELPGSLAYDTDRLAPVRSRFPGEVVEIAKVRDPEAPAEGPTMLRPIRNGDYVHEGDLLAVVWSKDLGQQKSALVDALSKQRLDLETLKKYQDLYDKGSIPERQLRDAERNADADDIAVKTAVRTLRSWRLNDKEIKAIYAEAERLAKQRNQGKNEPEKEQQDWARVEVRAPISGVIVEKNLANAKSAIVDTSTNLFMISDLSRLTVWAYPFEEDLPVLQALPKPIPWTIHLKAEPKAKPLTGYVSEVRPVIDPTMHTGLVRGYVDNKEGRLLAGQFVSAVIHLPPLSDEVVVPTSALVEDGDESIIFVHRDPREPCYAMRKVQVVRRGRDMVHLRWTWPQALTFLSTFPQGGLPVNLALAGLFEGSGRKVDNLLRSRLRPEEEWVVTSGALELKAELKDLQDQAKK
jgi:cobalt-zinc-cadmium efflux system membrane fusion protein